MTVEKLNAQSAADAFVIRGGGLVEQISPSGIYLANCIGPDGKLKWEDKIQNLVTTAGKTDILNKYFDLTTAAGWYMGLISSVGYTTGPNVADTSASHGGWTEAGAANAPTYSQSARPTAAWAAGSGGSKSLSAALSFSITSPGTVKGAFMITVATKDGTTGTLYSAGTFSGGDKVVGNGDTLNVTYTASV